MPRGLFPTSFSCSIILHNIRSVYNVGSIFRTADAAGVSKIYLVGYTPSPTDRFGRSRKDFAKVSLGAEKTVPWEKFEDALKLVRALTQAGFEIVTLEQDEKSISIFDYKPRKDKVAIIVGNEVVGVPRTLLDVSDTILEIPMRGQKESLNVSVAAGIALYCIS
jgi:23S rRNA (guanosine2251-2'-O)-methyltransferase